MTQEFDNFAIGQILSETQRKEIVEQLKNLELSDLNFLSGEIHRLANAKIEAEIVTPEMIAASVDKADWNRLAAKFTRLRRQQKFVLSFDLSFTLNWVGEFCDEFEESFDIWFIPLDHLQDVQDYIYAETEEHEKVKTLKRNIKEGWEDWFNDCGKVADKAGLKAEDLRKAIMCQ